MLNLTFLALNFSHYINGVAMKHGEVSRQIFGGYTIDAITIGPRVALVYLPDYDMNLGKLIASGVDLWLNTPQPPLEASGTSGMKAALNGVPSLSVLDGWWIEGHIEGVTGWAIGDRDSPVQEDRTDADAASLYDKIEHVILPLFHQHRDGFIDVMRHAIALNGSFFNSHRMVEEYVSKAYAA